MIMLKVTVSGSFRRHMTAIHQAVTELREFGFDVLSPSDPRVVDQIGEFIFVASDKVRSIKMVEDRHLECIRASDFLWLVAPDGYVGQSASMELGYAAAVGVPIFCEHLPTDGTLQKYVQVVPSISAALPLAYAAHRGASLPDTFLIDPIGTIERAHRQLDFLRERITSPTKQIFDSEGEAILYEREALARVLAPSGVRETSAM
jgi:hypothetical protein